MDLVTHFGTVTNLVISVSVTLYGLMWLREGDLGAPHRFQTLAYRCWWASWLSWALAWSLLLVAALIGKDPIPLELKIVTLAFDNLNSVFMILVYFVVTRGN